ncbi:MAG: hypothetical protein LCH41_06030 [Armatimonadetes bacterium]|nr:hypothetical protein [Armatimonadota bacterium]
MNPQDPYASESKKAKTMLWVGLGALVVVLAIGGGMAALGLLTPKGQGVTAQVVQSTPALPAVPTQPEPSLPLPIEEAKGMPKDVLDWLEHLRRIEEKKKGLVAQQMGEFAAIQTKMQALRGASSVESLIDPESDPLADSQKESQNTASSIEDHTQDWQNLRREFMAYPAPTECVPIQASYSQAIDETGNMFSEMSGFFARIASADQGDLQGLLGEAFGKQGKSSSRVDSLRKQTDQQVDDICRKYDTRKWFSIPGDLGGGGMLGGIPGF